MNLSLWPHGDPNAVVQKILAQPAYHTETTTRSAPARSIWEQLWDWIVEQWHAFLHQLARFLGSFQGARGAGTIVELLLLVAGGVILVFFVARMGSLFARRHSSLPGALGEALPLERDAAAWLALSKQGAKLGNFQAAVAALFMAALRLLDERGVISFDSARTPNEYRTLLARARAAASPAFDRLTSCFVRATYASDSPPSTEYETAEAAYEAFALEVA